MRLKNTLILAALTLFFCYGLIWQPRRLIYPVATVVSFVQYPFLFLHALFIEPFFALITSFKTHHEYHNIIKKNGDERSLLLKEIVEVRAQLNYYKDLCEIGIHCDKNSLCHAQIMYKQLHHNDSFFIIDKGSYHGVTIDMVAVLNNVLLGRVTGVAHAYSYVMPLHNKRCHVPIVCAESRAHGVFRGGSETLGHLDFISHLEPLVDNELVLTSGDGLVYPQGLALGRIKSFMLNELGFLYQVEVEPLYNLEDISYCSIVSKNTQQALNKLSLQKGLK